MSGRYVETANVVASFMNIAHPRNAKVLAYVGRGRTDVADCAPPDSIANPYYGAGCHPEIVERLWEQLNAALPQDSRFLVRRVPALVHVESGIILALGMGTAYGLYLPGAIAVEAEAAGCRPTTVWSGGATTNIRETLGDDWRFGRWHAMEPQWCRRAYDSL